jgi:hypothetical protein
MRALLVLIAAAAAAIGGLLHTGTLSIPDRYNPWAALRIDEPPGWLTRFKLARLGREPALCRAVLAQAEMRYTPLPDREIGPGCGYANAVRIDASSLALSPGFALSCRAAVSLALWERHVLHPAAQAHFGQRALRLEHFGSFACRNVYGREGAPRSRSPADLAGEGAATYGALLVLGNGFILTAVLWAAALAFIIDRRPGAAAVVLAVCAVATVFGLVHSPLPTGAVFWPWAPGAPLAVAGAVAGAYGALALVALLLASRTR